VSAVHVISVVSVRVAAEVVVASVVSVLVGRSWVVVVTWIAVTLVEPGLVVV